MVVVEEEEEVIGLIRVIRGIRRIRGFRVIRASRVIGGGLRCRLA